MKATKIVGIVSIIAGIVMIVAGALTWGMVTSQLQAEKITVPGDSALMGGAFAGKPVGGPLTAYAQADAINMHAMKASEGLTYAELGAKATEAKEAGDEALAEEYQTKRNTVMNGSFLRASLFSSVIAYGVAALVVGLGLIIGFIGWALTSLKPAGGTTVVEDRQLVDA